MLRLRRARAENPSFDLASVEERALRELVAAGDAARITSFDVRRSARSLRDTIAKLIRDERRELMGEALGM